MTSQLTKGIQGGLVLALFYVMWTAGIAILGGEDVVEERFGRPFWQIAIWYLFVGLSVGAIVGRLLGFVKFRESAQVVGFIAGALTFAAAVPLVVPREQWLVVFGVGVPLCAWLVGAWLGAYMWDHSNEELHDD